MINFWYINNRLKKENSNLTSLLLNGEFIKCSTNFKYLGVILDKCLSFNDHIDYISSSLTTEAANRTYKITVLHIFDNCDTSFATLGFPLLIDERCIWPNWFANVLREVQYSGLFQELFCSKKSGKSNYHKIYYYQKLGLKLLNAHSIIM